jgi:hypothetical protein
VIRGGTMERCLAREAVVDRETVLQNTLPRAALYHSVIKIKSKIDENRAYKIRPHSALLLDSLRNRA